MVGPTLTEIHTYIHTYPYIHMLYNWGKKSTNHHHNYGEPKADSPQQNTTKPDQK